jgi:hypothetical protein
MTNQDEWVCDEPKDITEMIEYWSPFLGISDWAINVKIMKQMDIHNEGVAASKSLLARRQGWIELARSDSRSSTAMNEDTEMSVVHELLHIMFAAWHDSSRTQHSPGGVEFDVCCEQPIDQLAETLVTMRRSTGHKFSFEGKDDKQ